MKHLGLVDCPLRYGDNREYNLVPVPEAEVDIEALQVWLADHACRGYSGADEDLIARALSCNGDLRAGRARTARCHRAAWLKLLSIFESGKDMDPS